MIKEEVPQILGKGRAAGCKDREKLGLERLDGTFIGVATMHIRPEKLELYVPLLLDDTPVVSTGFVLEDFKVDTVAAGFEVFHDGGVGSNAVGVLLGL